MQINIMFIVIMIILILGGIKGYQSGLTEGIIRIVSFILGISILIIVAMGIRNVLNHKVANVIVALIFIIAISLAHKIIDIILEALKAVMSLPVISWLDHIAGIILGMAENIILLWMIFLILSFINVEKVNEWITIQVNSNIINALLYKSNYLIKLISSLV